MAAPLREFCLLAKSRLSDVYTFPSITQETGITPLASFRSSAPSFGFVRSMSWYIGNALSPDRAIGSEGDAI
jgi:hypothetical protein